MKAKPKAGMKLHTFLATGGKPKDFKKVNKKKQYDRQKRDRAKKQKLPWFKNRAIDSRGVARHT